MSTGVELVGNEIVFDHKGRIQYSCCMFMIRLKRCIHFQGINPSLKTLYHVNQSLKMGR